MINSLFKGYLRSDGRKGIRNNILVVYTVECAHYVAREIAYPFRKQGVQVIGFGGCYPSKYAEKVLHNLCTHPNTFSVLIVSLGCEGFRTSELEEVIRLSGREVSTIVIQQCGGTQSSIGSGMEWIEKQLLKSKGIATVEMKLSDLIIGSICGGSDATTGIVGNPSVGRFSDNFILSGGTAIFEETGEMIGLEKEIMNRGATPELSKLLKNSILKAEKYYSAMGHGSFSPGNADGGLTTIEEKSLSSYSKSGNSKISGILKPGIVPPNPGLYLLDVVPDGAPKFGYPNINDSAEIVELISCGCQIILFVTGRGSVVGSAVSPVIKITGNPVTYMQMKDDMDINAGKALTGEMTLDDIAAEIEAKVIEIAGGEPSASERLGHHEFVLTYKTFQPLGPGCLPKT
jgi:altronate hydrolase